MKNRLLSTASLLSVFLGLQGAAVLAQGGGADSFASNSALNSTADPGTQGGFGHSSWRFTETPWDYEQKGTPGKNGGHFMMAPQGWADKTNTQGAGTPNGPKLFGTPSPGAGPGGQSGAVTSAPFQGTYAAPGNFALRNQGRATLPPTELTSIVKDSGYSFSTYGDEGTDGPPPLSNFTTIDGGLSGGMTTGHPSDAPSAWGYPQ